LRTVFFTFFLIFAHRFFAAFEIAALPAADNTRFFAPFTSTVAECPSAFAANRPGSRIDNKKSADFVGVTVYKNWLDWNLAEAYKPRNRLLFPTQAQVKCSSMRLLHWYGFLSNRRSFRPWCNVSDL
jgi:hypothetical protein